MSLKIYWYPKCGTCRMAVKKLEQLGHKEYAAVNLFEQPPSVEELKGILSTSALELKKLFNTSGEVYREMNLKDKLLSMSEDEQLQLLASNGRLIKRPIVTDGTTTTVGYKEEQYDAVWGG